MMTKEMQSFGLQVCISRLSDFLQASYALGECRGVMLIISQGIQVNSGLLRGRFL